MIHLQDDIIRTASPVPDEDMTQIPEYLSTAAEDICRAVQYETEENLEQSVTCYR